MFWAAKQPLTWFWLNYSSRSSLCHSCPCSFSSLLLFLRGFLSRFGSSVIFESLLASIPFHTYNLSYFFASLTSFSAVFARVFLILSDPFARLEFFCVLVACAFSLQFELVSHGLDLRMGSLLLFIAQMGLFLHLPAAPSWSWAECSLDLQDTHSSGKSSKKTSSPFMVVQQHPRLLGFQSTYWFISMFTFDRNQNLEVRIIKQMQQL